jgi:hypothetical protein
VDGVVTQGRKDYPQWVTLYDIYTSNDQTNWNRVSSGENGQVTCSLGRDTCAIVCADYWLPVSILCDTSVQGQFPGNVDNTYNQFSVFSPVKAQYAFIPFSSR